MQQNTSQSPRSPKSEPYISVSVTDPVKLGNGVQSYISYRVITQTNLPDYQGPEKIVIRRYSDFVWLRDRLFERYKGIFIPPLPEKSAVEKFRFSAEFIEMRRQGLDTFVNRIASHHDLRLSDDLRLFLQADEETMERVRAQDIGLFKKKPADLMQILKAWSLSYLNGSKHILQPHYNVLLYINSLYYFQDMQSKVSDVVLGKEKPVEESTPEYEKMKHYIFELEEHLAEAQKHAFRLVKRHRELGQSLSDFGKAVKLLGACEGESLGKAFSELGAKSEALSMKLQAEAGFSYYARSSILVVRVGILFFPSFVLCSALPLKKVILAIQHAHHLLMNFEEPLKDYVRAVQSIKATIADRATAFKQHCELAETVKLKEINLDKLMLTRSDKFAEAEKEYRELKEESEEATTRFETIVSKMNEEMGRFQEQKTADMGLAFHEFAKGQARLANGIAEAWRALLPKLEACSS
ncbi:hypothetical protein KSS87_008313 [Heliosperma pusillum]|nr:hypothetical protein KSS87_008313 [Heliosperma pusillum]